MAAPPEIGLLQSRCGDEAEFRAAVPDESDRHAPHPVVAGEIGGAVDRIDDPQTAAAALAVAPLLTENAIVRKGFRDAGPQELLDVAIGLGQPILGALHRDAERALVAEVVHGE